MSQSTQILRALQSGRRLTPIDALNEFNCFRLSARIYDLKQSGWDIKTRDITTPSGKEIAEYWLPEQNSEATPCQS